MKTRLRSHHESKLRPAALLVLLPALCALGGELRAQQTPSVQPGERVRVTAFGFDRRVGKLVGLRSDTLVFQPHDEPDPVPLAIVGVGRLEVPRGRQSPLHGGLIGGTLGFAAGGAVALLVVRAEDCPYADPCLTPATMGAVILPWISGLVGGLYGALRAAGTERWVSIPPSALAPAGSFALPPAAPRGALVRVRVTDAAAQPVVAHVVGVRGDSLVLRDPASGAETAVPLAGVQTMEIGAGRSRAANARRWATVGAGFTGVVAGLVSYAAASGDPDATPAANALLGGVLGAPLGAAVGWVAGYANGGERWVRLPPLTRVTVAPGREGGVALGLTFPAR
jgi:hypothetical protein